MRQDEQHGQICGSHEIQRAHKQSSMWWAVARSVPDPADLASQSALILLVLQTYVCHADISSQAHLLHVRYRRPSLQQSLMMGSPLTDSAEAVLSGAGGAGGAGCRCRAEGRERRAALRCRGHGGEGICPGTPAP